MKNIYQSAIPTLKKIMGSVIAYLLLFFPLSSSGQTITTTTLFGTEISIQNFPGGVCGNEVEVYLCENCPQDHVSLADQVNAAFEAIPHSNRVRVQPKELYFPKIQIENYIGLVPSSPWNTFFPIYSGVDAIPPSNTNEYMDWESNTTQPWNYNAIVTFSKGSTEGYLCIPIREEFLTTPGSYINTTIVVPFIVEGPTQASVAIIDTVVEPQIPYLVLHAPPGDGSSSAFQKIETNCRQFKTNYADEGSHSANLAVKLGVKGSIGFINTIDYEFSVTMSAGLETGDLSIVSNSNQTCVSVAEGFATSSLTGPDGGGDVFIGYGTDLVLGLYELVSIDPATCTASIDTGLIYAPTGLPRKFIYTKEAIEMEMKQLREVVSDSLNNGPRVSNNAQNQLNVWDQVLSMNAANVNNPDNELIENVSFSSNTTATPESSIKIVETNTIDYEHYIKGNIGLEAKIEIGGSGVTGGYEYKGSKRFGESQNLSTENSKILKYTLTDDDGGDRFDLQIVRDPMYGTPIFRVEPSSKSSCPYQGGYQRDQPLLTFVDGEQEFTLEDVPKGTTGTFQIKICNDSDEERTYHLKGNPNTNLNGAIIEGFGNNLFNTNDQGVEFTVPANDCLDAATLSIKQANTNILDYEDIEIFLNVDCQPASAPIASSVFLNARFSETTSIDDFGNEKHTLAVQPNPNFGSFEVIMEDLSDGLLYLMDMTGKKVFQKQVKATEKTIRVDQGNLSSGIYMLTFQSGSRVITTKVAIN